MQLVAVIAYLWYNINNHMLFYLKYLQDDKEITTMKIIGVDPGYAIVGVGVVEYKDAHFTTLDYGAITTSPDLVFADRLKIIYDDFNELVTMHHPDAIAVEKLFFSNNRTTGIDVAQARGIILLIAAQHGIPCFEYTPVQVKLAVVGYGQAIKKQVIEMTTKVLHLKTAPKPDDVADALAIAICHAHTAPSLMLKENRINRRML